MTARVMTPRRPRRAGRVEPRAAFALFYHLMGRLVVALYTPTSAMRGRQVLAARSLTIGAVFLAAAAVFHLFATPHIAAILRKMLDAKVYGFLEPILSFVFVLNAILLIPLS